MSKSAFLLMETIVALAMVVCFSITLLRFGRISLALIEEGGSRTLALEAAIRAIEGAGLGGHPSGYTVEIIREGRGRRAVVTWKKGQVCLVGR